MIMGVLTHHSIRSPWAPSLSRSQDYGEDLGVIIRILVASLQTFAIVDLSRFEVSQNEWRN